MHFLSMSENGHLAFTGRHFVHIYSTRYIGSKATRLHIEGSGAMTSLDLLKYIPKTYNGNPDRISAISCSISRDGHKLVVVDSEKNVYIFERLEVEPTAREPEAVADMIHRSVWYFFASFRMDLKIIRGEFDKWTENLFLIDKHGHVLISSTASPESIVSTVQLIHHSALTLDLVQDESGQMLFTCDGFSNILYSFYGEDCAKMSEGHGQERAADKVNSIRITPPTTQIANFILFYHDNYMLLAHKNGVVDLWDFDAAKHLQAWNIFHVNHGISHQPEPEHEIQHLKLTEVYDHAYFAAKLATYKEIPIFDLDLPTRKLRKLGQVKLDYEYSDFVWSHNNLYVYNPENSTLVKKYDVSSAGVRCDPTFHITTVLGHLPDFKAFVNFNKETIALNDYFSTESVSSWAGRKAIHEIFKASTQEKIQHSLFMRTKKRVAKNRALEKNKSSTTTTAIEGTEEADGLGTSSKLTIPPMMASEIEADILTTDVPESEFPIAVPGPSKIPIAAGRRPEYGLAKQRTKGFEVGQGAEESGVPSSEAGKKKLKALAVR